MTYRVVTNESKQVNGIVFDVTAPSTWKTHKTCEFYFNILLNDGNTLSLAYGTPSGSETLSTSGYYWDGNGTMTFNNTSDPNYIIPVKFSVTNCTLGNTLYVTCQNTTSPDIESPCPSGSSWSVDSYPAQGQTGCSVFYGTNININTTYTYTNTGTNCQFQ